MRGPQWCSNICPHHQVEEQKVADVAESLHGFTLCQGFFSGFDELTTRCVHPDGNEATFRQLNTSA
jgi:hypothetical protein